VKEDRPGTLDAELRYQGNTTCPLTGQQHRDPSLQDLTPLASLPLLTLRYMTSTLYNSTRLWSQWSCKLTGSKQNIVVGRPFNPVGFLKVIILDLGAIGLLIMAGPRSRVLPFRKTTGLKGTSNNYYWPRLSQSARPSRPERPGPPTIHVDSIRKF
jgi:hypothetical protein